MHARARMLIIETSDLDGLMLTRLPAGPLLPHLLTPTNDIWIAAAAT